MTKSMKERLIWLKPKNKKMAQWFRLYAEKQDWIYNLMGIYSHHLNDEDFLSQFIDEWSKVDIVDINDDVRKKINRLRSSWRSSSTRVNTTFSLSTNAKNKLKKLVKIEGYSQSFIVESLIIYADELTDLNYELKRIIKNDSTDVNCLKKELENIIDKSNTIDEIKNKSNGLLQNHSNEIRALKTDIDLLRRIIDNTNTDEELYKFKEENKELKRKLSSF